MSKKFLGNYRGLVVDNLDPAGLGRIKIKVYPMFKNIADPVSLPWAVPAMGLFTGAGVGFGSFAVPSLETFVYVFFEAGNIYQPVYFAEAQTAGTGIPMASQIDYPDSKVWETKSGIAFWVNQKEGSEEVLVYHPTGTYLNIMPDGQIQMYAVKAVTIQANTGNVSLIAAADNVVISAVKNVSVIAGVDATVNATRSATVTAGLNASITAGGKATVSATGIAEVTSAVQAKVNAPIVTVAGATSVSITAPIVNLN